MLFRSVSQSRYLKSIICSVAYPAFILGKNPKATIIAVSYNDELSQKLALDCRKIIESYLAKNSSMEGLDE